MINLKFMTNSTLAANVVTFKCFYYILDNVSIGTNANQVRHFD